MKTNQPLRMVMICAVVTMLGTLVACGGGGRGGNSGNSNNTGPVTYSAGDVGSLTVDGIQLDFRYVPSTTLNMSTNDDLWISETEVTYELWKKVYDWATTDAGSGLRADGGPLYYFQNAGGQGGHIDYGCSGTASTPQHPVVCITWRDAIVWTNAFNEYLASMNLGNFEPVYNKGISSPIRDSRCGEFYCASNNDFYGSFDVPHIRPNATGFRIPTLSEWTIAARYIADTNGDGDNDDPGEKYPIDFASGADAAYTVTSGATDYDGDGDVQYTGYVSVFASVSTLPVKSRAPNALGLYDMSGNAREFVDTWSYSFTSPPERVVAGGSWADFAINMQIAKYTSQSPFLMNTQSGFRLVRTHFYSLNPGEQEYLGEGSNRFAMRHVPPMSFPTRLDDSGVGVVYRSYWMAETEVTYELWNTIRAWAVTHGYVFANTGHQGGNNTDCLSAAFGSVSHPVTCVNWRDSIVWLNALTEWYNTKTGAKLDYVYTSDPAYAVPLKNSSDGSFSVTTDYPRPGSIDDPYVNPSAKGFRLPYHLEWELAARFIRDANSDGDILDAGEYYPGNYASGASADISDFSATSYVAWYGSNAVYGPGNATSTSAVAGKRSNQLGLYDMSGNVSEWNNYGVMNPGGDTFDRLVLGGSWSHGAERTQVGMTAALAPFREDPQIGFRIARTE